MNQLVFDLELITPMFLKADNPRGRPVLRAAPVRGEIRYWLRALTAAGVSQLKEAENNVLGDPQTGSVLSVWVKPDPNQPLTPALRPMLPHLLPDRTKSLESQAFGEGQHILLGLRGRPCLTFPKNGLTALLLWLNLGGVGKRARRGFGSLQCEDTSLTRAWIPEEMKSLLKSPPPQDGAALIARIESLLKLLPGSPLVKGATLPPAGRFRSAPYPSFQDHCWAVVVGQQAFPTYTQAMQDFWRAHLRAPAHLDPVAYGQAAPRHASPLHLHCAKSDAGYHLVLTVFFAASVAPLRTDKLRNLLQDCCTAYGGTAFFN